MTTPQPMTPRHTAQVLGILDVWGFALWTALVYIAVVVNVPDVWLR